MGPIGYRHNFAVFSLAHTNGVVSLVRSGPYGTAAPMPCHLYRAPPHMAAEPDMRIVIPIVTSLSVTPLMSPATTSVENAKTNNKAAIITPFLIVFSPSAKWF